MDRAWQGRIRLKPFNDHQMGRLMPEVLRQQAEVHEQDRSDQKKLAKDRAERHEAISSAATQRSRDEQRPIEERTREAISKVAVGLRKGGSMSQTDAERIVRGGVNGRRR